MTHDEPELLYHYTNTSGLLGLVQNQDFWATDARYLNDSSEVSYASAVTQNYAERLMLDLVMKAAKDRQEEVENALDPLRYKELERIGYLAKGLREGQEIGYHPHVVSFSANGDQLSQWRGYGHGTEGYALGFSRNLLDRTVAEKPDLSLLRVTYGIDEPTWERLRDDIWGYAFNGKDAADSYFKKTLLPLLASIKDPGFREEKEWRLLSIELDPAKPRFRVNETGMLIPYVEIPWPTSSLREIKLGPGINTELRKTAVQELLFRSLKSDAMQVKITTSEIPFRR